MKNIPQACIQEFSSLIGIPYEELDCYQLVVEFFKRLYDLNFLHYNYVNGSISKEEVLLMVKESSFSEEFARVTSPVFGDLIVLNLYGYPVHIGVYLGENKFLHTLKNKNSCIEQIDYKWKKRIEGYYRWQSFNQIQ